MQKSVSAIGATGKLTISIIPRLIKKSGINYTILHQTWVVNALTWFVQDDSFIIFGKDVFPVYWTNLITHAIQNEGMFNIDLPMQGKNTLTFAEAVERFINLKHQKLKI